MVRSAITVGDAVVCGGMTTEISALGTHLRAMAVMVGARTVGQVGFPACNTGLSREKMANLDSFFFF